MRRRRPRAERVLFSRVLTMAEQHGRVVRLLIVPARNAAESIVAAAIRLRSALIFVGESVTLSADDQARLVGAAWEEAEKPPGLDVRLIVQHQSGGRSTYHLGAHAPTLTAHDLDLIHQVWLDAVKHIGPHVHHHDIVRAALTNMANDLHGPDRDDDAGDDPAGRASSRRTRERHAHAGFHAVARSRAQPSARRSRDAPRRPQSRRPGRRLPPAAAPHRRGDVRISLARRAGSAAESHGAGGRGGAPQRHGAGRPHDVPRRAARAGDASAPGAAHAGRTLRRGGAARLSRRTRSAA